jgi:beta-lactam-binding protein with PASTA domain
MPEREAKQALVEAGFTVRSVDQPTTQLTEVGVVLAQRPAAGARAPAVSQVILTVGRVPSPSS